MQKFKTHYDNLQIAEHASDEVIRGAYRYLCQKWHPDKHPGDAERAARIMRIINQAYDVLSDPERRKTHDAWIRQRRAELQEAQERFNAYARAQAADAAASAESEARSQRETEQSACDQEAPQRSQGAQAEAASGAKKPPDVPGNQREMSYLWIDERLSAGPHPLRRFFARIADAAIIVWLTVIIFTEIWESNPRSTFLINLATSNISSLLIALFTWLTYHSTMLALFGATPGKWIFGIVIHKKDGAPITPLDAFGREILVNFVGFGGHVPFLSLVTMIIAGHRIEKHGSAYWDDAMDLQMAHRKWDVFRAFGTTGVTILSFVYIGEVMKQEQLARFELLRLRSQQIQLPQPAVDSARPRLAQQPAPALQIPVEERGAFLLSNSCGRPIQLALHYIDVNGTYQTRGWWTLQPNERTYLHDENNLRIYTKSADWYYYAFTIDGSNLEWRGDFPVKFEGRTLPMIKLQDTEGDSEWAIQCDLISAPGLFHPPKIHSTENKDTQNPRKK